MRNGPSAATLRKARSLLAGGLSAVLVLLSPGTECWAQANSAAQGQASLGTVVPGTQVGAVVVPGASLVSPLLPNTLSVTNLALPSLPVLTPTPAAQAVQMGVRSSPMASPSGEVGWGRNGIPAAKASVPIPSVVAPSGVSASPSVVPVAKTLDVQTVLEKGAKELSKSQSSGQGVVLDRLFTGTRVRGESSDPVLAAQGSAHGLRGLLQASSQRRAASVEAVPSAPSTGRSVAGPSTLENAKVFITRAGREPVAVTLGTLGAALDAEPGLRETLNGLGRIRLALSKDNPLGGLSEQDVERVQASLRELGITARFEVENVPVDWARKAEGDKGGVSDDGAARTERGRFWRWFLGPITAPFREALYLVRTFRASYTKPTMNEVIGGVLSKAVPTVLGVGVWYSLLAANPMAMAAAIGVSVGLNVFHGIWINTWSNLQNNIGKQRGLRYQTVFNLVYGQWWGVLFRYISWTTVPNTVPPWSYKYWKDMGITTIVGTFCGTLGIQGLNALYDNGRLTRFQRGAIQQFRDLLMCLGGVFFGSGSMVIFWSMFAVQQGLDLAIYAVSRRAQRRPIVYIADEMVAATQEFQNAYPVRPGALEQESPLKQAWDMLLGSPFVKPFIWLAKKLFSVFKKK
ncbi:MAG: hypothetical protein WC969_12095 [Elusimicrobiota bacterium]|jgi:hypothetical protein